MRQVYAASNSVDFPNLIAVSALSQREDTLFVPERDRCDRVVSLRLGMRDPSPQYEDAGRGLSLRVLVVRLPSACTS
jgi:hypothetical protein